MQKEYSFISKKSVLETFQSEEFAENLIKFYEISKDYSGDYIYKMMVDIGKMIETMALYAHGRVFVDRGEKERDNKGERFQNPFEKAPDNMDLMPLTEKYIIETTGKALLLSHLKNSAEKNDHLDHEDIEFENGGIQYDNFFLYKDVSKPVCAGQLHWLEAGVFTSFLHSLDRQVEDTPHEHAVHEVTAAFRKHIVFDMKMSQLENMPNFRPGNTQRN